MTDPGNCLEEQRGAGGRRSAGISWFELSKLVLTPSRALVAPLSAPTVALGLLLIGKLVLRIATASVVLSL